VLLHDRIRGFARQPLFHQRQQHHLRKDNAVRHIQIGHHPFGINHQFVHHIGEAAEHKIQRDRRVRSDDPLHGRMADIPFVPQRDILQRRHRVRPHQPGQTRYVFRKNRIALMRHGGRSLLSGRKILFGLPHLRPLQQTDLLRELVQGRRDNRQRREKFRMTVPLHDLRRHGRRFQTELVADVVLHGRIDKRKRADRARDLAVADRFFRLQQAFAVALHFLIPQRHFQPERNRFRVNSVRPADHQRVLMFHRPLLEHQQQHIDIFQQKLRGLFQLNGKRGIEHIRRGHAHMNETSVLADGFRQGGQKGDHIVPCGLFDFIDAFRADGNLILDIPE